MELKQAIEKRQSIRKFKGSEIPEHHLREIIEAAGKAPSGENLQNWHFVVIQNKETKAQVREIIREKNEEIALLVEQVNIERAQRFRKVCKNFTLFAMDAPVLILVFSGTYTPSGYIEYQLIHRPTQDLDELFYRRNPGMQSLGAALQTLALKAVELGYGTCWLTSGNYAGDEIQKWAKEQNIFYKEGYFMASMMALGIPEDGAKSPGRKPPEEIYTYIV